jgi:hypothetical protein
MLAQGDAAIPGEGKPEHRRARRCASGKPGAAAPRLWEKHNEKWRRDLGELKTHNPSDSAARYRAGPQLREKPKREPARIEIKAENTRRKISDLVQTQNWMQAKNISLRSKQSLHPIHGGLRPPSLFLIGTKIGTLQKLRTTK